jgi:hypothetical protein
VTPETLDRLAPEALPGVRLLPVVHARPEMAAVARAVLDAASPGAVAVELPTTFREPVARAIARLPRVSLVLAPGGDGEEGDDEEAVVWTCAPGEPFAEALRWAAERGRPGLLIDPGLPYPERHDDAVPDPLAMLGIGPVAYLEALVAAVAREAPGEASEADRRRETGMAYHLRRALDELRESDPEATIVALVGAAHVRRLAADLAGPVAAPFARTRRHGRARPIELRHVEPKSLTALLPDPPLAHAVWELLRHGEPPPEPDLEEASAEPVSIAKAGLTLLTRQGGAEAEARRERIVEYAASRAGRPLPGAPEAPPAPDRLALSEAVWRIAERSYARQTREEVAPWQRRLFFDFGRRLARVQGMLATGLLGWVTAARGVGDDNLAWEVLEAARAFPWQEGEAEIPTVSVDGSELELPDSLGTRRVRFRRRHFKVKRRPVMVPVRERATTDDPSEWLEGFRGGSICSYPPEDLVVEGFGRRLRARAKGLLAAERQRSEPFATSLLDGVDVRETLRHPEDPRVWVREMGRVPGEAGSVVVIFDRDLSGSPGGPGGTDGERYPYLMTWLGEHHDESDMAFYATDPAAQVVGPGILRATYGGFLMTLPPGRLFDVWRDPEYLPLLRPLPSQSPTGKSEVLLAAAIDYSQEKLVVHVAARAPSAAMRHRAKAQGKRIVHLPLGSLSPNALKKIRTLHILAGRDKRGIAKDYVW